MKTKLRSIASWSLVPGTLFVVLAVWEATVRLSGVDAFIFPTPSGVAAAMVEMAIDGSLVRNFWVTFGETVAGFAIAAFLGIGLGALISEFRWARRTVYPYLVALQTVPKIAIAPMLVLWFGFGITSKIVIAATIAIFPILVNTIEGLTNTDETRIDMLRSLGGTRAQVFRMVKFPSALPFIFAGLGSGVVLSLLGAVVGEFVGARAGLGNLILIVNARMDTAGVFAILIVLGSIGIALNILLQAVQSRVVFWARPRRSATGRKRAAPKSAAQPARTVHSPS